MAVIQGWNLYTTEVVCKRPFAIATGVQDCCQGVLLELATDSGLSGWGEGVPLPLLTGETLPGCLAALQEVLLPAVLGEDGRALESLGRRLDRLLVGHPAARCALDLALHDLASRSLGVSPWVLLGGSNRPVATNYSIGLATPEEAAEQARALVEQDYVCIKLKVGQDPDLDVERVRAVRAAVGPEIALRVDANEGWNYLQARRFLQRAEGFQLQLVEQPLARADWEGLRRLRQLGLAPIAADESLRGVQEARHLAALEAVDIFNIKLMKCGGIRAAREIITLARAHGISLMIGGMVGESSIAVAAATAVASTWEFEYADLDADLLIRQNYSSGGASHAPQGYRFLDPGPGWPLGELRPDHLHRVASRGRFVNDL